MTTALAWYAYAVLPGGAPPPVAEPVLPGAPFELVGEAGVVALASPVPRELFDREDPANRAGDPEWIGARARAHHGVAAAAAAAGACLPLAFGALFASRDNLRTWLVARQAELEQALAHVAGRAEWAVRLQEDEAVHAAWLEAHDPDLRALAGRIATASAGTAFLLERRQTQARSTARAARLAAARQAVAAALGDDGGQEGCWTVLADAVERQALEATLAPLAAQWDGSGLALALSGPWPPYAFARKAVADA
jgi:hypothetical protein